ncbi:EsaB/YukD family protein [Mycobacterium tilburgii]|uniref:EsaB/YukD family protein n=1 Tax=Mycobacterium tilburgii TaxID=44467 RepID=UPI0021B3876F|nr:EsaB/YukD family protein [Mycobacterium tilburgii]
MSIRELIPRIRATLASGRDDELVDDTLDEDGPRPYSLAPLRGTPFILDATLKTLGVDYGEQLILCKLPPGLAAPPVVEDIADASAIHSAIQADLHVTRREQCGSPQDCSPIAKRG